MRRWLATMAAVLSRLGCRLILARSLLKSKNTHVAGVYPHSYFQALCVACQHWDLAGGSLWYLRVPVGDVTCELYCRMLQPNNSIWGVFC